MYDILKKGKDFTESFSLSMLPKSEGGGQAKKIYTNTKAKPVVRVLHFIDRRQEFSLGRETGKLPVGSGCENMPF